MFLMRQAKVEDTPTLLKLAKMVHFINLPADRDIIADKTSWSSQCFLKAVLGSSPKGVRARKTQEYIRANRGAGPLHPTPPTGSDQRLAARFGAGAETGGGLASGTGADGTRSDLFMFVLEDTANGAPGGSESGGGGGGVLGTSQIIAQMGGPGRPNVSLRLSRKEMFSQSLQMGATHMVAKLHLDETGPTEIGGLILQPSYRGHRDKLGRFLSLVRFHFIGLHRRYFSERIIAELMGAVTPDGQNTLWEYLGRRFINLTYAEADSFCQYSKEFITALFPQEEIFLTLLAPEARSVVAQVGPETLPARRMLEKLGFAYKDLIDPFDGGPTLEAQTRDISLIRDTRLMPLGEPLSSGAAANLPLAIVSTLDDEAGFRAVQSPFAIEGGKVRLPNASARAINASPGDRVGFTPYDSPAPNLKDARASSRTTRTPKRTPPPSRPSRSR